jgi:glycosyltransferase involved in cell wall biosynthesis
VNDGSTDRTKRITENLIKKNPQKIRLLDYDQGHSPAFARNRGAEAAKGEILFFLDADDWVRDDTLEMIIKAFEKHKDINFVVANRKAIIPKDWRRVFLYGTIARKEYELNVNNKLSKEIDDFITIYEHMSCPYIAKANKFKEINGFDEGFYYTEDLFFTKKLMKMKISKLLTPSIEYYTDLRSTWKDFYNQCKNVAKSLHKPLDYSKVSRLFLEFLISFFIFPFFVSVMILFMLRNTKDIFISFTSPFLYIFRRVVEIYEFMSHF